MSDTGGSPWPVPVDALGVGAAATVVFRHRGAFHLTVIVKASFQWAQGARAAVTTGEIIHRAERTWEGEGARSPAYVSDLAPFIPRAEVRVHGHAYAPPGITVPASSVRLGVFRDVALVEKTIHVYGDRRSAREAPRPFQRMPLRYELTYGGPGTENPAGVGAGAGVAPNLVSPLDPMRPSALGAIGRAWPSRARRAPQIHGLEAPIYDLPDDFDFAYFQASPDDQQVDALGGDEWLLLDGMHPSAPRLSCQLPGARAEALVWAETGPSAGKRWSPPLALDTVFIDADQHRVDLVWRGSFTLPGGDAIVPDLRAAAGVDAGQTIVWPDVDAALLTRRAAAGASVASAAAPDPGELQRQETQAIMGAVPLDLPFASSARSASSPASPLWASPASREPARARETFAPPPSRDADTPLPDDDTPAPALPFSRFDPELLGAAEPTFASIDEPSESTYDALVTGSTAPPPPAEGAVDVAVPRPAAVPVVVPPPAVASGPLGGGLALGTEGHRLGAAPPDFGRPPPAAALPPPPPWSAGPPLAPPAAVPPARVPSAHPPLGAGAPDEPPPPPRIVPPRPAPATSGLALIAPPPRVPLPSFTEEASSLDERTLGMRDELSVTGTTVGTPRFDEPSADALARTGEVSSDDTMHEPTETTSPVGLDPRAGSPADATTPSGPVDDRTRLQRRLATGEDLAGADLSRLELSGVDFSGANLVRVNLAGARLVGCNFNRAKLADAKLTGADLDRADLRGADLTRADLARARLAGAVLHDAQITQASFAGVEADSADFAGAKGARASFSRARLSKVSFAGADLPSADLTGATLEDADLRGAQLADAVLDDVRADGARFDEARLVRVRGHGASLARASLCKVVASGSGWDRAVLDGATFTGSDLSDAAMLRASVAQTSFVDADLRGAKLANAAGDDADFSRAKLDGADLRQARLDRARFVGATLVKVVATKVSLLGADLREAELRSGNFRGARMKDVDLQGASLRDADLRDADLEGAKLGGADRTGVRLQGANLDGASGVDG